MSGLDIYVLILCFLVFGILTGISVFMLRYYFTATTKLIKHGLEDEKITTEYQKELNTKPAVKIIYKVLSGVILSLFLLAFVLSLGVNLSCGLIKNCVSTPQVVMSSSMQYKHDENKYLVTNNLNDQFATFDLIFTKKLPDEFDLELYDIVVYEYRGELIIHRIIGIEEPNESHPDKRHFLLRGDSVKYSDEFPVTYEQMRAIYEGDRIPFVGSFFAFMQSPAGYLCLLTVVFAMIATPIAEKKLREVTEERLREIGVFVEKDSASEKTEKED